MAVLARAIGDPSGPVIVMEADVHLETGAVVLVNVAGRPLQCEVVAGQAQVRHMGVEPTGRLLQVLACEQSGTWDVEDILDAHSASATPYLSSEVRIDGRIGRVLRLDIPKGIVTVEMGAGDTVSVGVADLNR